MAKMYGLNGVLTGKLGATVFAVRSGVQIARQYQPIINNPKSTLQQFQRAKMNLVGQLSSIMPHQVISGLGNSKTNRRARFLKKNLLKTTSGYRAGSTTEIEAKLTPEDIVLSEGNLYPVFYFPTVVAQETSVQFNIARRAGVTDEEFLSSGVLLVAILSQASGVYESVVYSAFAGADATEGTNTITIQHSSEGSYQAFFYEIPFSTVDGGNLATVASEMIGTSEGLSAILTNNPSAVPVKWGHSLLIGNASYVTP